MAAAAGAAFPELGSLTTAIDSKLESFASGSQDIQAAALNATKFVFDLCMSCFYDPTNFSHINFSAKIGARI